MATATLSVPDISCEHCERAVLGALNPVEGVEAVTVDIPAKTVNVTYDNTRVDIAGLSAKLAAEDYPVAEVRAQA